MPYPFIHSFIHSLTPRGLRVHFEKLIIAKVLNVLVHVLSPWRGFRKASSGPVAKTVER